MIRIPLIVCFWFVLSAYVIHILDESLLGGSSLVQGRMLVMSHGRFPSQLIQYRCNSVRPFFKQMLDGERSLKAITVSDVDSLSF